jgi:hypothetical protein
VVVKVTSENEQEVAEALFDLGNLATFMEEEEEAAAAGAEVAAPAVPKRKRARSKKGGDNGDEASAVVATGKDAGKKAGKGARADADANENATELATVPDEGGAKRAKGSKRVTGGGAHAHPALPNGRDHTPGLEPGPVPGQGPAPGPAHGRLAGPGGVTAAMAAAAANPMSAMYPPAVSAMSSQFYGPSPATAAATAMAGPAGGEGAIAGCPPDTFVGAAAPAGVGAPVDARRPRSFKHCATHVYIAHFIDYQQQMSHHALLQQHFNTFYTPPPNSQPHLQVYFLNPEPLNPKS